MQSLFFETRWATVGDTTPLKASTNVESRVGPMGTEAAPEGFSVPGTAEIMLRGLPPGSLGYHRTRRLVVLASGAEATEAPPILAGHARQRDHTVGVDLH